jgi:hypothetical protein
MAPPGCCTLREWRWHCRAPCIWSVKANLKRGKIRQTLQYIKKNKWKKMK